MDDLKLVDYLDQTAQQLVEAGEYASVEEARAALQQSMQANKTRQRQMRRDMINNMNRRQRRAADKQVNRLIKKLQRGTMKPSEQFNALPETDKKKLLLDILFKVHQQNEEFEEMKRSGADATEAD